MVEDRLPQLRPAVVRVGVPLLRPGQVDRHDVIDQVLEPLLLGRDRAQEVCRHTLRVHGRAPDPTSASVAPVRYLMTDVLPLWVRPNSQKTGTGARLRASARRAWKCRSSARNRLANRAQPWSMVVTRRASATQMQIG